MNDEKLVGKLILQIRLDNHLSQEAFAEKIGVSRQTVYNWEADISKPGFDKMREICSVFQLPMSIFLKEECAISQSPSVENVYNEEEHANSDQKFSHKSHKKRIILFSAILISVMIIFSIILIIFGIAAFPGEEEKSHLTYSVYYIGSFSQFIFWTTFAVAVVVVAVFLFLIVRLAIKNRKK